MSSSSSTTRMRVALTIRKGTHPRARRRGVPALARPLIARWSTGRTRDTAPAVPARVRGPRGPGGDPPRRPRPALSGAVPAHLHGGRLRGLVLRHRPRDRRRGRRHLHLDLLLPPPARPL